MISDETREALRLRVVECTIQRLEKTYSDFFLTEKGFADFPGFFRNHLYAPPNKAIRDASLEKLYERLKSVVGADMTLNIHKLIQLIHLSDSLDSSVVDQLISLPAPPDPQAIPPGALERATATAGRFEDRLLQVDLICETLTFFYTLAKLPLTKLILAPVRVAAGLVHAESLVETMEEGYRLSKQIRVMQPFVTAFAEREKSYIHRLESEFATARRDVPEVSTQNSTENLI